MVCMYKGVAQTYMSELAFKLAWTYMVTFPIFNTDVKNDLVGEGLIPISLQCSLCMNNFERRRSIIWIVDSVRPHDSGPWAGFIPTVLACCTVVKRSRIIHRNHASGLRSDPNPYIGTMLPHVASRRKFPIRYDL